MRARLGSAPHRCAAIAAFAALVPTRAPDPASLRAFGGAADAGASALVRVEPGRLIMAGSTLSPLFSSPGPQDAFLAWFDDSGELLGGVQFGSGPTTCSGLAPAGDGGVFVSGSTLGNLGAPNAGGSDAWVARCDSAGNRLWIRQLGSSESDGARLAAGDDAGGVFVAGDTWGDLGGAPSGGIDAWAARYDQGGALLWLHNFGTSASEFPTGMVPDRFGGYFVAGSIWSVSSGLFDVWIARYDSNGKQVWMHQIGSPAFDGGKALSSDGLGGVFFTGATDGILAGSQPRGTWLARYDALGNQLSIMQFASSPYGWPEAVCADGLGGAFIAGNTTESLGGPNAGGNDVWITHVPGGTSVAWIDQFGTALYENPHALAPAGPGTVLAAGSTFGNLAPGGGGFDDAWLARYDLCYPDCNADGVLTVPDFGCFQTRFITADLYADCNADGVLTVSDFGCFQTRFVAGCP